MQPNTLDFNPLPAGACLLDPSLAVVLMEPDHSDQAALRAAKKYVIKQSECPQVSAEPVAADRDQSASCDVRVVFKRVDPYGALAVA